MNDPKETKHPSFGTIGWSRVHGRAENFFMSSLTHDSWVEIELTGAKKYRKSGKTWVSAADPRHIRVRLTEAQFAAFITTPNVFTGTPCTVTRLANKGVAPCPEDEQMVQFRREVGLKAKVAVGKANQALKGIEIALAKKGSPKKKDLREIQDQLQETVRELGANMPFLIQQFEEHMDDVYHDAAARFEGYMRGRAEELGFGVLAGKSDDLAIE